MKTHLELRKAFQDFWEEKKHKEVPPIPLVPKEDPTTLFTGSGMQQLIPYLQGEQHAQGKRLWNIQPCFRSQDIEEVGDTSHTTFFEMMGNWSLGDYFKQEQLPWMWEFFTKIVGLDEKKLYVTVFEGAEGVEKDTESFEIWKRIGVPEDRIHFYGVENNWWSRSGTPSNMPVGEIGGPDSEVFYEFEEVRHDKKFGEKCHPNCQCGRFLEIGNSVFIQYRKEKDGKLHELPQKNVDYGGGLERLAAAVNNNPDVFLTDLYQLIIEAVKKVTNSDYQKSAKEMRIIADHVKAASFLIKEGLVPSNKEQGYVLRRLIRRSVFKLIKLGTVKNSKEAIKNIFYSVAETYKDFFKETDLLDLSIMFTSEVEKFEQVIHKGTQILKKNKKVDGKTAFDLYQNYGFPIELTIELADEWGQTVNLKEFDEEFEKHKEISRKSAQGKFKGGLADEGEQTVKYHTATHLIHQALFDVIGNVRQEGSNITSERLRFDFFSEKRPSDEDIKKVTGIVNQKVSEGLPVRFEIMPKEKAEEIGARAFFKEKYSDQVKVYFVGDYSAEFCGGPHVTNSKEVGKIDIYKFEKIGSSLYRIYAK